MKKKVVRKNKKVLYFDGGALLSLATPITPKVTSTTPLDESSMSIPNKNTLIDNNNQALSKVGNSINNQSLGNLTGQLSGLIPKDTTMGGIGNGALQGASMGSALGPWGMAGGALLGGIFGGVNSAKAQDQKQLTDLSGELQKRNQMFGLANGGNLIMQPQSNIDSLDVVHYQRHNDYLKSKFGIDPQVHFIPETGDYIRASSPEEQTKMDIEFQQNLINGKAYADSLSNLVPNQIPFPATPKPTTNAKLEWFKNGKQGQMPRIGFAEGGNLLTEFNGGYTHNDSNPNNTLSGIPQGQTPDGNTNTVEKGETKLKDFIFSDQLKVPKKLDSTSRLPKSIQGKTFAKASKILNAEMKDRPFDAISKDTNKILLGELQGLNEQSIMLENNKILAKGGHLIPHGGKDGNSPWLNTIQPFQNDYSVLPENPILADIEYANALQQGSIIMPNNTNLINEATVTAKSGLSNGVRPANVDHFYDKTHLQSTGYIPANTKGDYTRRGYLGNTVEEQNAWVKGELNNNNIKSWLDPESKLNKGIPWRQKMIQKYKNDQPKVYQDLMDGTMPQAEVEHLFTENDMGPLQSLVNLPSGELDKKDFNLKNIFDGTPTNRPKVPPTEDPKYPDLEQPPSTLTTTTPPTRTPGNPPNLWPEAGLFAAVPYLGLKPNLANPTTMSTGYLKPQLVDEMSMRAGIDSANRGNIGALANVTGGNASAQRAGLLGAGSNYMDATSGAFLNANQMNNAARQGVDQFNIQNQTGVAGQNMQALNQFELENKELINNINAKKADEFSNTIGNYVENGFRRRNSKDLLNDRAAYIKAFTGYDPLMGQQSNSIFGTTTPGTTTTEKVAPKIQWASQMAGHQNYGLNNQPATGWTGANQVVPNYMQQALGDQYYDYDPSKGPLAPKCHGGKLRTMKRSLK